ncbi:protein lysine methyltransferase [Dimargaris xerosporica]|nr:protein lysine methyltransferase [Dimargaris xerosporica]
MTIPLDAVFASANAPQLSDDVAVQSLGERGRGCIATAAIPKGRCVAVCRPFATVISHDWLKIQRQAAKRVAKSPEQDTIVALEKHHLDHLRFIVLMLIKRRQALAPLSHVLVARDLPASPKSLTSCPLPRTSAFVLPEPTWADFMTLQSCEIIPEGTPMAAGLPHYRKVMRSLYQALRPLLDPALMPSERVFEDIVYREKANGFGYWDDSNTELVGYGVFPQASFFNHACAPNVRKVQQGSLLVFVTERDVAPGEELCIYYGYNQDEPWFERRQRLLTHYFFDCCCIRCRLEQSAEPA